MSGLIVAIIVARPVDVVVIVVVIAIIVDRPAALDKFEMISRPSTLAK